MSTCKFSELRSLHFLKVNVDTALIRSKHFPSMIIILILITLSLDDVLILLGENSC